MLHRLFSITTLALLLVLFFVLTRSPGQDRPTQPPRSENVDELLRKWDDWKESRYARDYVQIRLREGVFLAIEANRFVPTQGVHTDEVSVLNAILDRYEVTKVEMATRYGLFHIYVPLGTDVNRLIDDLNNIAIVSGAGRVLPVNLLAPPTLQ